MRWMRWRSMLRSSCSPIVLPMRGSRRLRAVNPGYGEAYALVAHQLELHYRYEDAVTYYRKAIEADPRLWAAHSPLGIDLMRLGKEDEPLKELELSYNNGYRDAATVNSLRLLDSYKNFVDLSRRHDDFEAEEDGGGSAAAVHAGGAAHDHGDLRQEVPDEASGVRCRWRCIRTTRTLPCARWGCRDWVRWA